MSEWMDEYKPKVRRFMTEKGIPVLFDERFGDREPEVYGWRDGEAYDHGRECGWVVPEGATLTEETYSQFTDTFSDNRDEVGVNVEPCHCTCGKYTDVTLRWDGTVDEMLTAILGYKTPKAGWTL